MAAAKGDEAEGGAEAKPKGKKRLILLALPVLLGGIGAGLWFSGLLSGGAAHMAASAPAEPTPVNRQPVFVSMPDITANLNAPGPRRQRPRPWPARKWHPPLMWWPNARSWRRCAPAAPRSTRVRRHWPSAKC